MTLARLSLLLALSITPALAGCSKDPVAHEAAALPMATVDQAAAWIAANEATAVDANNPGTREKMGVVPGAIKLTSFDKYDVAELPADRSRRLIFYCANTHCGASHEAAERALTAGYTRVEVLPEGIAGWVNAGKKVEKI